MQDVKKGGSFLTEALIISLSNFAVKIIGVVYKIPLAVMLGTSMGVFTAAYSIYAMLFMISTSGLPVAISRMVAASAERGRKKEIEVIYRDAIIVFGVIGLICSAVMFIFAEPLSVWSKHPNAVGAMKVIAPTLFFVCVTSACRGYFQGLRNMYPTAISQFIEAFFKLVLGLGAAYWAKTAGYSTVEQAAFAVLGLTVGVFFGTVFLIIYKRFGKKKRFETLCDDCDTTSDILKRFAQIALPVTITSSALYMTQFLDTLMINNCLVNAGYVLADAENMYSAYTTLALSISDLIPSTLVYPIAISILPAVAAALASKRSEDVSSYCMQSMRISAIIASPFALCLVVLSKPCISFIYGYDWGGEITLLSGNTYSLVDMASFALSVLAIGIILLSMVSTTNALLQALGKVTYPMISVIIGVAALAATELTLCSIPSIGLFGAPIASLVCYLIALILNMYRLQKLLPDLNIGFCNIFLKPLVSAIAAGAVCAVVLALGTAVTGGDYGRIACFGYVVVSAVLAVPVYAGLLIVLKGITADEICLLPKGNAIKRLLMAKKILK